jgi:thermitase
MGKKFSVSGRILLVFSAILVSASVPKAVTSAPREASAKPVKSVPGQVLVKTGGVRLTDSLVSAFAEIGVSDLGALNFWPQIRKVELKEGVSMDEALAKLRVTRGVLIAEPNYIYSIGAVDASFDAATAPADKDFKKQWSLSNTGQKVEFDGKVTKGTVGADMKMLQVWNEKPELANAAADIVVGVIDTGIFVAHDELKANIWKNAGEIGSWTPANDAERTKALGCKDKSCNKIDDDRNGLVDDYSGWNWGNFNPQGQPLASNNNATDDNGHGTHVSGTIGAAHNSKGVRGVNGKVKLMPLKFLSKEGSGSLEGAIESIGYAIKNGAHLINASWGGSGTSEILDEAISIATDSGILFIAAAGNSSEDNDYTNSFPSNHPEALAVVATDNQDKLAVFSSYGKKKTHVAAPGQVILSTVLKGGYDAYSGTSMATPHVVGLAALILGVKPEFKGKPLALRKYIMDTTDISLSLLSRTSSGGRINAYNAVNGIIPAGHEKPAQENWSSLVAQPFQSEHPYQTGSKVEYTVKHPGAKWIRIKVGRHSVEWDHDYVAVYDGQGNLVDAVTGLGLEATTGAVKGDTAKVVLVTDGDVNGWGFEILGYEYMN